MRVRLSRSRCALATSLASSLAASANGGGVAGYSGKPNLVRARKARAATSATDGGTAPQVSITGPATLAAGQTGDYTLVVSTGQSRAAGGVAASDGTTSRR